VHFLKLNSGDLRFTVYALMLKLWLRSNPISKSFLLRK